MSNDPWTNFAAHGGFNGIVDPVNFIRLFNGKDSTEVYRADGSEVGNVRMQTLLGRSTDAKNGGYLDPDRYYAGYNFGLGGQKSDGEPTVYASEWRLLFSQDFENSPIEANVFKTSDGRSFDYIYGTLEPDQVDSEGKFLTDDLADDGKFGMKLSK